MCIQTCQGGQHSSGHRRTNVTACAASYAQAWLTFGLGADTYTRQIVNSVLITVWGLRLGMYLLIRVLKRGHDARCADIPMRSLATHLAPLLTTIHFITHYAPPLTARFCMHLPRRRFDEMRSNFFSFLGFWVFQMLWVWLVSLPNIFLNSAPQDVPIGVRDYIGWALW